MNAQHFFLKLLNFAARILGVFWVLGGVAFVISAFVSAEDRVLHFVIGAVVLLVGIGFVLVRPAQSDDVNKVRLFVKRIGRQ